MNEKLLRSIEGKKRELDRNRPLNPSIVRKLEEEFTIAWTYNSNAIEGNTLTLQETEIVINSGITIGGKTVNEHFEAINHKKGIDYLKLFVEEKGRITEQIIRNLHLFTTGKHKNYQITLNTAIGGLQLSTHPISYETKGVVRGLNPLHTIAIWERFRGRGSKRLIGPLTLLDGMGDVITQKCPYRD